MQTSDSKMKTYHDFLSELLLNHGFSSAARAIWEKNEEWMHTIYELAAQRFAAYAFEEGCKAQKPICAYFASTMKYKDANGDIITRIIPESILECPKTTNPFSSPQNNEQ